MEGLKPREDDEATRVADDVDVESAATEGVIRSAIVTLAADTSVEESFKAEVGVVNISAL